MSLLLFELETDGGAASDLRLSYQREETDWRLFTTLVRFDAVYRGSSRASGWFNSSALPPAAVAGKGCASECSLVTW